MAQPTDTAGTGSPEGVVTAVGGSSYRDKSTGTLYMKAGTGNTGWTALAVSGAGAPTDVDYLVGTASGALSAEIAVGTTPGGELGGTWGSPTVDGTHSGSSHAGAIATAEAYSDAADAAHVAASDPHTGYLKESNTIDFLVGTATAELGGEIAVGATPGGELGGTWASPTVDASHSGSTHAATQAAAEATAAAADATHAAASDPHTGYLREATTVDFLVGTATAELAGEIVVGATPGGELGGTWASPTVDASHSGSAHSSAIDPNAANSLLAWSDDPINMGTARTPLAATIYLVKIPIAYTLSIANLLVGCNVAGTNYTNTQFGVYSSAGVLLGASAVYASAGTNLFVSSGIKTAAITVIGGQSLTITGSATAFVWAALHMGTNAATAAAFLGGAGASAGFVANAGTTAATHRCTSQTGHATNTLQTIGNLTPANNVSSLISTMWFGIT